MTFHIAVLPRVMIVKPRRRKGLPKCEVFHIVRFGMGKNPQNPLAVHAYECSAFPTLSTWFSTANALVLREKPRLCGKLSMEIPVHTGFSTMMWNVENPLEPVEKLRRNCEENRHDINQYVTSMKKLPSVRIRQPGRAGQKQAGVEHNKNQDHFGAAHGLRAGGEPNERVSGAHQLRPFARCAQAAALLYPLYPGRG